jgi:hypothetical protein
VSLPSGVTDLSVAFRCPEIPGSPGTPTVIIEEVIGFSTKDLTSDAISCKVNGPPTGRTGNLAYSVDASGITGGVFLKVAAQNSRYAAFTEGTRLETASSMQAPVGSDRMDIQVYSYEFKNGITSEALLADREYAGQAVPGALDGGKQVVLGDTDLTRKEALYYENVPAGFNPPTTNADFEPAGLATEIAMSFNATTSYRTMPADLAKPGDSYFFSAGAVSKSGSSSVGVTKYPSNGGPQTFVFPKAWSYSGPAAAALPTFEFDYTGLNGKPGVWRSADIVWMAALTEQVGYAASWSQNYDGGATTLAIPSLDGLKGFLPAPAAGVEVYWDASVESTASSGEGSSSSEVIVSTVGSSGQFKVP